MQTNNIEDIYELSPIQQGLLFHILYNAESGVYCQQMSISIQGNLNFGAFEQAWQQILARHSILRTAFYWEELEKPLQVVSKNVKLPLEKLDWRNTSQTLQKQQLKAFARTDRQRGFELSQAPLMRLTLIQLSDDEYEFIWTNYHLISDGWSRALVIQEVFEFYQALCKGKNLYLKPPSAYKKYITWLSQQNQSQAEKFWQNYLKGVETTTPLGVKKYIGDVIDKQAVYAEENIKLSKILTADLQSFARKSQLTINTIIQGAWALLLSRYSSEENVIFGITSSGRPPALEGSESMIGVFINTLPLRWNVDGEKRLLPWLRELQSRQAELREYEYCRLVDVQKWSDIPQGLPLFESILVFENYPFTGSREQIADLTINDVSGISATNYPITVMVVPDTELSLTIMYEEHYFDTTVIKRMLGHLKTLIAAMVAHPQEQLKALPMLSETERYQLLIDWNSTQVDYPHNQCIHELFEAQVARCSNAVAVVFDNEKLTYTQLDKQANQLASYLQKLGVKPEVPVGICVERSILMVVGILGILKAGGAYVPLDPDYPQERLDFMLSDAQVPVLLTQQHLQTKLPSHQAEVVCLDGDWKANVQENQNHLPCDLKAENLAYIIYTSGSTGKPKGVQINHRNVVNFLYSLSSNPGITEKDILLAVTTLSFDIAGLELFLPLMVGAKVVIVSSQTARDGIQLLNKLETEKVTIMQATPSTWGMLLEAGWSGNKKLKVLCGGEALSPRLAAELQKNGSSVWNLYGPTEATIWSTIHLLKEKEKTVPIGRPIANTQTYILDKYQQPVPIGVNGELYIGGDGLSRGYRHQSELTNEKFIPNPFDKNSESYLYKTGDLVRYQADGNIEFISRIDHQVKLRGFRIELGEIEAVLTQNSAVSQAIVMVREDDLNNKRLVAYVVPEKQTPTINELRTILQHKLPDYMIPGNFVFLEKLPLTPNGKVNRRVLPIPDTSRPELKENYLAPRTTKEKTLAEIWSKVLKVEEIGIYDNFFALGGDSIRSIQVCSQVRERGFDLSIQEIFKHQTIEELAKNLTQKKSINLNYQSNRAFSLITAADRAKLSETVEDAYPLTTMQMGMLFYSKYNPNANIYHNVSSFHLKAVLQLKNLQTAVDNLVNRHPILRTCFNLGDFSQPLQIIGQKVSVILHFEDLHHLSESKQKQIIAEFLETEKQHKFDWAQPPLLRLKIHQTTPETFQFTLTFHHAILDGWSLALMLSELFEEYFSLINKQNYSISPPTITFRDFVALQQKAINSTDNRQYWLQKLTGAIQSEIPRWRFSNANNHTPENLIIDVAISEKVSQGLKDLAKSATVPLKSVLLTAHLKAIGLLSGKSDVITGLSTNGRAETKDGDRVLGLFLNTLPFRVSFNSGSWIDLVKQTFELEQELLPYRWYPMSQIKKDLGGENLFETSFNFTHFHRYQNLQKSSELEVLDIKGFAIKEFVLLAQFSLDLISSDVKLFLECDPQKLSYEQAQDIGNYYTNILSIMAINPLEIHENENIVEELTKRTNKIKELAEKETAKTGIKTLKLTKRKAIRNN
ncbi:amino acid adenylation enzyme/thioester reductase family protein [Rivularia sp. PCC 7116]|uniref:non-ribosomal peptide synthetase n=1 Tax=Rivularia sp. PCC 7116 TaxID=373994 RepID=UPI00029F2540|nr:non-ribosomal peptide synthetase [Rivularia sp. PCC 7116]AFY58521.1 amino acid adenylation enzyme/thioester reductase family protein [Rivularia sp. PCC 7116]